MFRLSGQDAPELEAAPASGLIRTTRRVLTRIRAGDLIENRYRVLRAAATGGMGDVYVCDDTLLVRPVAIKLVRLDGKPEARLEQRFFAEARITAQLQSPHIARLYDYGVSTGGEPYMVSEFVDGPDLFSVLQIEGPLSAAAVVSCALQICEGLREAHGKGIVHCDLKPENLVRTRTAGGALVVKIVDFGISRWTGNPSLAQLPSAGALSGSPHYMSPEQIETPADVDARTDIWSLGVVMFELLTGCAPFSGSDELQICASVRTAPVPTISSLLAGVSPELEETILRCLKKDRDERFSNVDELTLALSQVVLRQFAGEEEPAAIATPASELTKDESHADVHRSDDIGTSASHWVRAHYVLSALVLAVTTFLCAQSDQSSIGHRNHAHVALH